jgi:hypothetical protein
MRDSDPTQIRFSSGTGKLFKRKKVKDPDENLGGEKGYGRERVTQSAEELLGGIYFLINGGNGRDARTGVINDGSEMIKFGFDPGEYIEERGRFHVT